MLTRDIELSDAILDLLDNCTDGIQRTLKRRGEDLETSLYEGFRAEITIRPDSFKIEDNCGGIEVERARKVAFRMGRPLEAANLDDDIYTIGTYGIGMKRSMFKMGRRCRVVSQTATEAFEASIPPTWFEADDWNIPFEQKQKPLKQEGTCIEVVDLLDRVSQAFSQANFMNDLANRIAQLYSYIIQRGFSILINGKEVEPTRLSFRIGNLEDGGRVIAPYVYTDTEDGVKTKLIVGFYRPILSDDEVEEEKRGVKRYARDNSGWTVVCNDRVVVFGDRTELTGWGTGGLPRFHNQFMAISGIAFFDGKNADDLPLTTTKRGIDANSLLYLKVRDRMVEGTKIFTNYTNQWKDEKDLGKEQIEAAQEFEPREAISRIKSLDRWKAVRQSDDARRFIPKLPTPQSKAGKATRIIRYSRPISEIERVSAFLFDDSNRNPSEVGKGSFAYILDEADS